MLRTADLDYDLPPGAVATTPAEPRDAAKLLVVSRTDERLIEHATVADLPSFLRPRDRLVLNTTKVLAARLEGHRTDTPGKVNGLYLGPASLPGQRAWLAMLTAKSLREGIRIRLEGPDDSIETTLVQRAADQPGAWLLAIHLPPSIDASTPDDRLLDLVGHTPLPPYIMKARRDAGIEREVAADHHRYQTVYANQAGSVAAPTAGLHLTPALFDRLAAGGVARSDVLLHVGTGTFKPVESEFVEDHPMHSEWCAMTLRAVDDILATRAAGGRILAVGTTSVRTLESFARLERPIPAGTDQASLDTRLLITPGFPFRWTDALLTNFHLPRSTLLALVGAMLEGGVPRLKSLYAMALAKGYRFFSYGDAMLILP
ncbi:MAG: tRNA preQ1(34) S-adenosylmethionine ribosyltransferase-isomerase QueA [Phycisphaerae bacterium]|jgi:S-adenosylmethionine:tRNA ribosyltransferase-isomerase